MRRLRKAWSIGAGAALRLVGTAAILTFLALGVTACTGTGTPQPPAGGSGGQVSGTADFSSPSPLPADAQMVVRVVDNSQPDTATATIGETTVTAGGKSAPLPFSVSYDVSRVDPNGVYVVQANVVSGGSTILETKGNTLVITQGRPTAGIALPLKQP
jgi:putative lipoprotein